MNARRTSLFLALASLGAVVTLAVIDMRRTSPGPLSAVHGRLARLQGRSGCNECHGGLLTSMTSACRECHAEIAEQLDADHGLHGVLDQELGGRCALCHGEHLGTGFAVINTQSYRQAGFESAEKFEHARVGFAMSGKHLEIACADCHANASKSVLAEGERRFLGLKQECTSCHADVHKGAMHVSCVACHGQTKWGALASLGHERFLPLVGGHGDVECRKCHEKSGARALENEGAPAGRLVPRKCEACHESPHMQGFVGAGPEACVRCHAAEQTSFRDPALARLTPEQHGLSGFRLVAPHDKQTCAQCHDSKLATFRERYPGRGQEQCAACHADVHRGQFQSGPFARGGCLECHERERWTPHTFDLGKHAQASLPIEGAHAKLKCEQCHVRLKDDAPRRFRGTPDTCSACHDDAHQGFFDLRTSGQPLVAHGDCARCHGVESFAAVPAFDHALWTGFKIAGAHAQEECAVCHPPRAEPDANKRRFGTVSEKFGRYRGCQTCHADVHEGLFDSERLPARAEGREGCARCHGESSFRALPFGFDHMLWTGFALANGHASADCNPDPHAGQFNSAGRNDCTRCHAAAQPKFLSFDHEHDARFRLGEAHAKLACSACHAAIELAEGGQTVRYRPLPIECVDCHGVREDVLLRRKRGNR